MSVALMNCLSEMELIDVPWPEPKWNVQPDAEETPIEGLQWRYQWAVYVRPGLLEALRDYLRSIPRDDFGVALRLKLWRELALAEGEQFFEAQLVKHQFDPSWAQDLAFVRRERQVELSASQWRYCCWAGIRRRATVAQRQRARMPLPFARRFTRSYVVASARLPLVAGAVPCPLSRRCPRVRSANSLLLI
ncbi:hypothetical protein ACFFGH_16540 [Lysobacter korlensis]|uniref:Uncharacterized protein n=1 Tax=Lysobacter korlensis TaxID=553636 RepID=A0ABV6RR51_9GAMM